MREGSDHRLESALDESRMLREQLAEVQRAFEHHLFDGGSIETPRISQADIAGQFSVKGTGTPSRLLRYVRCRLTSAPGSSVAESYPRGAAIWDPESALSDMRPKSKEWARLRAKLKLVEEKSSKTTVKLRRAEARLAEQDREHAQCRDRLRVESRRLMKSVKALRASQQLVHQLERLIASMGGWLVDVRKHQAQISERLEKTERDLDSERSLRRTAEADRRADADRLLQFRRRLHEIEQELESERGLRRAAEQARCKVTENLKTMRKRMREVESQLQTERESQHTTDLLRREAAENLESMRNRLQRLVREHEAERDARRAAEQARALEVENISELRQRFGVMKDRLSERERLIAKVGEHIGVAWTHAQRLMSTNAFSENDWEELTKALRHGLGYVNHYDE